jgi:hypothetical protein
MIYQVRNDIEKLTKDEAIEILRHLKKILTTENHSFAEREHIKYDIYRIENKLNHSTNRANPS